MTFQQAPGSVIRVGSPSQEALHVGLRPQDGGDAGALTPLDIRLENTKCYIFNEICPHRVKETQVRT